MAAKNQDAENTAVVAVDPALIDRSVKFINKTIIATSYKGSLEIGEYLLEHFFDNDIEKASSRNPHKPLSFQKLCKRDDLGVHPSTLSRMVKVASQEKYFVQEKTDTKGLTYSNRLEFTKLPNDKKKLKLVEKCIKEEMSFSTLSARISKKSKGVTPLPPLKLISNVDKLFEGTQLPALLSTPDKLERLRSTTRTQMKEKANTLLNKMETLKNDCNSLITTLDDIEKKKKLEKEEQEREKEERRLKRDKEKKEKKEAEIKEEKEKKEKKDKEEKEKGK